MKSNIIVLLSGNGTTMQSIVENCNNANVITVVSNNKNALGINKAMDLNIPLITIPRDNYIHRVLHELELQNKIYQLVETHDVKLIVLAGFMQVLSPSFIEFFDCLGVKIINIHPSLLPNYKGLNTHKRVIESCDNIHGMTIHYVNSEIDSGEIIFSVSISVEENDTPETLETKIKALEQKYYHIVIDELITKINLTNE